jgi:hypothetical protein
MRQYDIIITSNNACHLEANEVHFAFNEVYKSLRKQKYMTAKNDDLVQLHSWRALFATARFVEEFRNNHQELIFLDFTYQSNFGSLTCLQVSYEYVLMYSVLISSVDLKLAN